MEIVLEGELRVISIFNGGHTKPPVDNLSSDPGVPETRFRPGRGWRMLRLFESD